jgi:peptide chain release factor 1
VTCQNEKSQLQNKEQAMKILKARLLEREVEERQQAEGAMRQAQVGTGGRSAKVRTYNFPQGRITDHRVGVTSHNIEGTMNGDLEEFTQALAAKERADKLAAEAENSANGDHA